VIGLAIGVLLLGAPEVGRDVERALQRTGVPRGGLSVLVGRAGGEPLFALAPDEPRIPASNQKVLTAAAALESLGRDFAFETRVARGPAGEIVVAGEGDPNLSGRWFDGDASHVLRALARDVAAKGVRDAPGGLVLDATRFDDVFTHPDWPADQLHRWYCAPVAALVYNDSCWDVTVRPGSHAGRPAAVDVRPALLAPAILNRCTTVGASARHVVHLARAERGADLQVRGSIRRTSAGIEGHVTVEDPVLFFGRAFRAALEKAGVRVGAVRRGLTPRDAEVLVSYRSGLDRTLKVMLTNSQNLYAECVLKRLGDGSFASGAHTVRRALDRLGVATDGLDVRDGSGLARTNRVTARALYGTLQAMRDEPRFVDALAAGGEGTLRRRYRNLGSRMRAKTGTIRGVTSLSGYVTGTTGSRFVFVILANGRSVRNARALQDRIVSVLADAE